MTDTKTRIPLVQAERMAALIAPILSPFCERIEIVGSLRRRLATNSTEPIGDIEFLAIPKIVPGEPVPTLFSDDPSETTEPIDLLHEFLLNQAKEAEEWFPRHNLRGGVSSMGRLIKHLHFQRPGLEAIKVDIFTCTPDQWGILSIVRTGPERFCKQLMTQRRFGGFCPDHLWFRNWQIVFANGEQAMDTPTEESVFAAINLDYLDIAQRERIAQEHTTP